MTKKKYMLADLEKGTFDPTEFKSFKDAVKINLRLQMAGMGEMIIPLEEDMIKRQVKLKKLIKGRIIPK